MSGRNIIPKELAESIRQCLGRKVKLSLKILVKLETKSEKTENKVLAFAVCRLFVLTAKVPTRVDQHFHYLDVQGIESRKPNQLCLTVCDRTYTYYTTGDESSSHEVDTMVLSLGTALKNIFPSVPLTHIIRKVDIHPPKRMQQLDELERMTLGGSRDMGPCGGFSTQYMCMCDYHALPYREEVAWDVDTIYLSHDTRELYLHDFDYLEQKDLIPIISALEYNTWFRKLRVSHSKLSHEAIERILHVVSKSLSLEELYLDNIGAKAEFANKISLALLSNSGIPIQKIDISHNPLEDKGLSYLQGVIAKQGPAVPGAVHISNPIGRQAKGLAHLNLSCCSLTSKGVNMVAHSLNVNKYMCQTLTYLNLASNSLRDDVNNLYNFLAQPNVLKTLDLSATECTMDAVFGALLRGCTSNLTHLNLSRNGFGSKKSREMLPSFKQFFTSTLALKSLILSYCKLPADALKNVLLGLACNENISQVELDLCSNQLGSTGAQILESCIHGVRCLAALDISDNCLENQLGPVVTAISKNKSIKKLTIGRNLNNIKTKHVCQVMEAVVQMIQEEDCVLESLSINDSRLKTDLHNLLNALGSNHCLQSLDISGNYMGDSGARLLAKALQINSKLQYISYDRNNVTLTGYSDIAYALQSNYTVKFMPFPVHDIMLCMKTAPERTDNLMRKIQDILYRNVSPMKYSNGQAFRLQQGFLLSSTQQHVDRLVLQTGECARALKRGTTSGTNEEAGLSSLLQWADGLISDAENSKQLISHLHDVVLRRDETGNPIETRLHQLSQDLHTVITNYLQQSGEGPRKRASTGTDMGARERGSSESSTRSERSTDTMSQGDDTNSHKSDPSPLKLEYLNLATPQLASKRKSIHGRKLRPQSVVDYATVQEALTVESSRLPDASHGVSPVPLFRDCTDNGVVTPNNDQEPYMNLVLQDSSSYYDLDHVFHHILPKNSETLSPKSDSIDPGIKDDVGPVLNAESLDSVSELPSSCGQLQHLGKARPRRLKTRAPTRPMGRADLVEEDHDISEGVDTFFRPGSSTPTTPLVSPDSENSPRLLKYGSTSSMESFPHTGGVCTASDRGSIESLTRSDSLVRSESDHNRDSPCFRNRSRDTEDEDLGEEDSDDREDKSISVSSLIGKLGGEGAIKLSPDLSNRKTSSSSTLSASEDKSLDNELKDDSPPKKVASGISKFGGMGYGGNILAEMKARQEKRTSVPPKDNDKEENERPLSSGLLGGVKLRSTGLANNLKSPTNGFPRASSKSPTPGYRDSAVIDSGHNSPSSLDATSPTSPKAKPPPPLAPKPRPKSTIIPERMTGDLSPSDDAPPRSVKELAASLAHIGSISNLDVPPGKKCSSLPRNDTSPQAACNLATTSDISGTELSQVLDRRRSTLTSHQMEELEESPVDGEITASSGDVVPGNVSSRGDGPEMCSSKAGVANNHKVVVAADTNSTTTATYDNSSGNRVNSDSNCKKDPPGEVMPTSPSQSVEAGEGVLQGQHLLRQTSHKHVLSTDMALDDVVNV